MRVLKSVAGMQRLALTWRRTGVRIALVPTMGYLHQGHLSLMRRARQTAGKEGRVVVSLFVNPAQFGPKEDLSRYPRDFKRDAALCRAEGVDVLFAPAEEEMYPSSANAEFSTYVVEEELSKTMEGASRPAHFRGVTTVVAKLFLLTQPDVAVFGAKDYQQAAVVQRMVRDLNFPVKILVAPTVREPDGLALSSRNKYLSPEERRQATVLWEAIQASRQAVANAKQPVAAERLKAGVSELIACRPQARLDYVEFFDAASLTPVSRAGKGTHMALAVFVGATRLIDNARL